MSLNKSLFLLLFAIGLHCTGHSQESPLLKIGKIDFRGGTKTKTSFLKSWIDLKEDDTFSEEQVYIANQRLKNLYGIGNAYVYLDTLDHLVQVTFEIEEIRTALPIANFGGIKDNLWFQIGFTDINWRGRGQTISAFYQNNDKRHSGNVYYRVPFAKGSSWGYALNASKWSSVEPLFYPSATVNYEYDNNGVSFSGLKHFGLQRVLEIGGTAFKESYRKSKEQIVLETPGPDMLSQWKYLSKIDFSEDFINYNSFYLDGSAWQLTLQQVFNTLDKTYFHSLLFKGRKYIQTSSSSNVAMRLIIGLSTNNDTPFAPFVVDSHVNLRGVGNRIERGTAQAVLNIEYRKTISHNNLWATQVVLFSDLGTWRNPGGEISDIFNAEQIRHFLGIGFRLIYKKIYGATLRVDYGIDVYNAEQKGFVLGLGQYF